MSLTPDTKALLDDAREALDLWSPVCRQLWCEESGYEACSEKNDTSCAANEDLIRELAMSPTKSDRDMTIVGAFSPKKISSKASFDLLAPNVVEDAEAAKPVEEPIADVCEKPHSHSDENSDCELKGSKSPCNEATEDAGLLSPLSSVENLEKNLFSGDLFSPDQNLMLERMPRLSNTDEGVSTAFSDGDNVSQTGFLGLDEDKATKTGVKIEEVHNWKVGSGAGKFGSLACKLNSLMARVYDGDCVEEIMNLERTVTYGEGIRRAANQLASDLKKAVVETKETFQPWISVVLIVFTLYRLLVLLLKFFYGDSVPRTC